MVEYFTLLASLLALCAVLLGVNIWLQRRASRSFPWKPDLSHNVKFSDAAFSKYGGHGDFATAIEKSPEQRREELRSN